MTRNRLLIWAILILLATNIATILSALRYSGRIKANEQVESEVITDARVMLFRDHLQLTESQMRDFAILNRTFSQRGSGMKGRMDMLRRNMVEELAHKNPDMKRVDDIAGEIGLLHKELKQATADYYLGLKRVCTPEQQEGLKEMFMVMSDPESDIDELRRGRMGPGQGQGQAGRGRNNRGMERGWGRNRF